MTKYYVIILIVIIVGILVACTNKQNAGNEGESSGKFDKISQDEAKKIIDENPDCIVLDVRTQEEYSAGHIPGAVCIPNETIDADVTAKLPDKNQEILVYCRSGARSKSASRKLAKLGYTQIKEFGGINKWQYDIEK